MVEVLESVADALAVNGEIGEPNTVLNFTGDLFALLVERVSFII